MKNTSTHIPNPTFPLPPTCAPVPVCLTPIPSSLPFPFVFFPFPLALQNGQVTYPKRPALIGYISLLDAKERGSGGWVYVRYWY